MNRIITYDLRGDRRNSDLYYSIISEFTKNWYERTYPILAELIEGFLHQRKQQNKSERQEISCAFDLMVIGVLLSEHREEYSHLTDAAGKLLHRISIIQSQFPNLENLLKLTRGFLYQISKLIIKKGIPSLSPIDDLIKWLRAIGEDTQAERIEEWKVYLLSIDYESKVAAPLNLACTEFSHSAVLHVGQFTENVNKFLRSNGKINRWRYDSTLLHKTRLEYHLAMLGNEILNQVNREAFLRTKNKIVILPPCMKALQDSKCKAKITENGEQCMGCTPSCRINEVTRLGKKHGFKVYIIPDELKIFSRSPSQEKVGIIGVSCLLTNWAGGWDTERLYIPAQGILLDYVGCKYHWDKVGFPTDMNINKLLSCLEITDVYK